MRGSKRLSRALCLTMFWLAPVLTASLATAQVVPPTVVPPTMPIPPPLDTPDLIPSQFCTPGPSPVGLAWDGQSFWISDSQTRRIYQLDPVTRQWDAGFGWQGKLLGPIAWDGDAMWVVDEGQGEIVRFDLASRKTTKTSVHIPRGALRQPPAITGLAWDGKTVWLCNEGGLCACYYRMDVASGRVLQSFFPRCEPRGLAFDGEYLWTIAYRGTSLPGMLSRRPLNDDALSLLTKLTFHWLVPARDPTALTFALGRLWVLDRDQRLLFSVATK